MSLRIETFSNLKGGNSLFKALSHPHAAAAGFELARRLGESRRVAIVDPAGMAEGFAAIFDLARAPVAGIYVQAIEAVGAAVLGRPAQPLSALAASGADLVFIASFDAERLAHQIAPLLPLGARVLTLDAMRLSPDRIGRPAAYLDPLNFATNYAFFRDCGGHHTRLVTTNYWTGYGAAAPVLALTLFDGDGAILADWREPAGPAGGAVAIDSRSVRRRFELDAFEGQLLIHAVGAAGHDTVKYALDTWFERDESGFDAESGECDSLSCTHDSNAWPADYYAGLPAPAAGERVFLWLQNCLPVPVPPGAIGFNPLGGEGRAVFDQALPPYATAKVDVGELLPQTRWPQQIEIAAGRYIVRPRYEIVRGTRRRIAHPNVERTDLFPNPAIVRLGPEFGKGFILPAPILPRRAWRSLALPTPMARAQAVLPIAAIVYDPGGEERARHRFGRVERAASSLLDLDLVLQDIEAERGHIELVYDADAGDEADGWLHALFRYEHRASGHIAETSFGAHIFNTLMTWRDEPQSYAGRAPGLSTRLFLRLGQDGFDTICQLIYPASRPWRDASSTQLILTDRAGVEVARREIEIACSGSLFWRYSEMFGAEARARAGADAAITVRDSTCRLFGYHGLAHPDGRFSFDHMFGF